MVTVAIGYDGSDPSKLALRWAADYAAGCGAALRIVHTWIWPLFTHDVGPVKGVEGSGLRHAAEVILSEGADLARAIAPDLVPRKTVRFRVCGSGRGQPVPSRGGPGAARGRTTGGRLR